MIGQVTDSNGGAKQIINMSVRPIMKPATIIFFCTFIIGASVCLAHDTQEPVHSSTFIHFPADSISSFEQAWYSSHLKAMDEPILRPEQDMAYFSLRVLYLPTWGRPIAFRYEWRNGEAMRRAVMLSGSGGYEPGEIREEIITTLSKEAIENLVLTLDESGYWALSDKDDVAGRDGSRLIVETIRQGEYRVFVRWTPEHKTEERNLTALVDFYTREFTALDMWGVY